MTPRVSKSFTAALRDWCLLSIMDNSTPPRDPNDDDEEDEEEDEDDGDEEPAVVREPDE